MLSCSVEGPDPVCELGSVGLKKKKKKPMEVGGGCVWGESEGLGIEKCEDLERARGGKPGMNIIQIHLIRVRNSRRKNIKCLNHHFL